MRSLFLLISLLVSAFLSSAMSVVAQPDVASPATIGTTVTWQATSSGATGSVWYRFRIRAPESASFRTVRDYSPTNQFVWVPLEREGTYQIETTALDPQTGDQNSTIANYDVGSRVTEDQPVITPTRNELVYLYSAPPCATGSQTRVRFVAPDSFRQFTPWQDCEDGQSVNVYLAGLRADTHYRVRQIVRTPDAEEKSRGPVLDLKTNPLTFEVSASRAVQSPPSQSRQGILLQSRPFELSTAVDLEGNLVWYYDQSVRYLTRPARGGQFIVLLEDQKSDDAAQIFRVIDVAGNTVQETNAGAVNAQLERMGQARVTSFHHEARRIPGGKFLVLAGTERILTDVQGQGDVDVLGDMILVLNRDLQVEWAWNAFDHLDVNRKALFDETCQPGTGGCPVIRLGNRANDWLHGNALQFTPDGNILYSARHQDWVIKIDYANGSGSGNVIWRLGKDGDFQFLSDDRWPWFSHQHDPNFLESAPDVMLVFDNGNTRVFDYDTDESRGQVLKVDEEHRTVSFILNVNLGAYSVALGSAQLLDEGTYMFGLGWMPNRFSRALEYDSSGKLVSVIETETQQYRTFRMRSLYAE